MCSEPLLTITNIVIGFGSSIFAFVSLYRLLLRPCTNSRTSRTPTYGGAHSASMVWTAECTKRGYAGLPTRSGNFAHLTKGFACISNSGLMVSTVGTGNV